MSRLLIAGLVYLADERALGIAAAIALSPYTRNPLIRILGAQPKVFYEAVKKGGTPITRPKPRTVIQLAVLAVVAGGTYLQVQHMKRPEENKSLIEILAAGLGGGVTTPISL